MTTLQLSRTNKISETLPASQDPFAGIPRHVWQSLFILVSSLRPEWAIGDIAEAVFRYRRALPFPELSAAAIRAAQNSGTRNTVALKLAMLDAADKWLETADK